MKLCTSNLYKTYLKKGVAALANRNNIEAVEKLRLAVELCPVSKRKDLGNSFYWLGISLCRISELNLAIKAWSNAQRLVPSSSAKSMYERFTNNYGMVKTNNTETDDYRAFCLVQLKKHLATLPDKKFKNSIESTRVLAGIAAAWLSMKDKLDLANASQDEKLDKFCSINIVFPTMQITYSPVIIKNNFGKSKEV